MANSREFLLPSCTLYIFSGACELLQSIGGLVKGTWQLFATACLARPCAVLPSEGWAGSSSSSGMQQLLKHGITEASAAAPRPAANRTSSICARGVRGSQPGGSCGSAHVQPPARAVWLARGGSNDRLARAVVTSQATAPARLLEEVSLKILTRVRNCALSAACRAEHPQAGQGRLRHQEADQDPLALARPGGTAGQVQGPPLWLR